MHPGLFNCLSKLWTLSAVTVRTGAILAGAGLCASAGELAQPHSMPSHGSELPAPLPGAGCAAWRLLTPHQVLWTCLHCPACSVHLLRCAPPFQSSPRRRALCKRAGLSSWLSLCTGHPYGPSLQHKGSNKRGKAFSIQSPHRRAAFTTAKISFNIEAPGSGAAGMLACRPGVGGDREGKPYHKEPQNALDCCLYYVSSL